MRSCPACGEPGIFEHSVVVDLHALQAVAEAGGSAVRAWSRCQRCGVAFLRHGPDELVAMPEGAFEALGRPVWILPPWLEPAEPASFQMSWDVVEALFERQAATHAMLRPLRALIVELRTSGYGPRLRAGQSLSSLGLSRSREHGLRPDQSHLFLKPGTDGRIRVEGRIGPRAIDRGPTDAALDRWLRADLEALARCPID